MRTVIAIAVLGTIVGGMWITFELLARASQRQPINP